MEDRADQNIEEWWIKYIQHVRQSADSPLTGINDYSSPCQVEVFWVKEPIEGQAHVITHDPDRSDLQIIVNGPYHGHNLMEEVSSISREDRWQLEIPPQDYRTPPGVHPTREDLLSTVISSLTNKIEQAIYTNFPSSSYHSPFLESRVLSPPIFFGINIGNISRQAPVDKEDNGDQSTEYSDNKKTGDSEEEKDRNGSESNDQQNDEERHQAVGGFIYPATWVDSAPERSFSEKVWGPPHREDEIILRTDVNGNNFFAFRNGLLSIHHDDGSRVLSLLNTFFGIGILGRHFQWRSLQGRELIGGRMGPDGFKSMSYETSTPSGRNQIFSFDSQPSDYERGLITSDEIEWILRVTEIVDSAPHLGDQIRLHLQAHTHFLDDEYTASFLLNWNIVEQHIESILDRTLKNEYNLNSKRRDDRIGGSHWFISHRLEVAEITDTIDENLYSLLTDHRKKRNSVVHEMEVVSAERSEDLDHLVSELLTRTVNEKLDSTGIAPVQHIARRMKPNTRRGDYNPVKW